MLAHRLPLAASGYLRGTLAADDPDLSSEAPEEANRAILGFDIYPHPNHVFNNRNLL